MIQKGKKYLRGCWSLCFLLTGQPVCSPWRGSSWLCSLAHFLQLLLPSKSAGFSLSCLQSVQASVWNNPVLRDVGLTTWEVVFLSPALLMLLLGSTNCLFSARDTTWASSMVGLCFTSHIASFLFTDLKWLHFNPRISQQSRPNGPENSHVLLALVTYCSYPYLDQRQHISSSHLSEIREVFISVYVPQFVGPQSWSNFHQDPYFVCVCGTRDQPHILIHPTTVL